MTAAADLDARPVRGRPSPIPARSPRPRSRPLSPRSLRPWLAVALALFAASCKTLMGPGSFNATISGAQLDEVVSMYVIVADDADLADAADPQTIDKLVRPERQAKYITFAQLKPVLGEKWLFELKSENPTHKSVKLKTSAKAAEATVTIGRKLLEARPSLAAIVLVNCGPKGWGASAKVSATEIENVGRIELEVRGTAVNRTGGS